MPARHKCYKISKVCLKAQFETRLLPFFVSLRTVKTSRCLSSLIHLASLLICLRKFRQTFSSEHSGKQKKGIWNESIGTTYANPLQLCTYELLLYPPFPFYHTYCPPLHLKPPPPSRLLNSHLPIFGKSLGVFDKDKLKGMWKCAPGPVASSWRSPSDQQQKFGPCGAIRANLESPAAAADKSTLLQTSQLSPGQQEPVFPLSLLPPEHTHKESLCVQQCGRDVKENKMGLMSTVVHGVQSQEGSFYIVVQMTLSWVPWKHFYPDSARCLGGCALVKRQSPLTSEQRETAKGKRLEIMTELLGKERISKKSFEVLPFMLHSSSSDR